MGCGDCAVRNLGGVCRFCVWCLVFCTRYVILPLELEGFSAFLVTYRAGARRRFEGEVPEAEVLGDEFGGWNLACGRGEDGS